METAPESFADTGIPAPAAMVHIPRKHVSKHQRLQTEAPLLPEKQVVLPKLHQKSPCDVVTPIQVDKLYSWLDGYDKNVRQYLCEGFLKGFQIPFHGEINNSPVKNLTSAYKHPEEVSKAILKEVEAGRIAGPFAQQPFSDMHFSPIGVVPKKTCGEFRFIQHLSYPEGHSINDGIPKEFCSVKYQTIDDASKLLHSLGSGTFMAKTDIEKAFRLIPVSKTCHHLLGFTHEGKFYYDKCLPMGLSHSCYLLNCFLLQ